MNSDKVLRENYVSVILRRSCYEQKRISLGVPSEVEDQSWKSSTTSKSVNQFANSGLQGLAQLINKK